MRLEFWGWFIFNMNEKPNENKKFQTIITQLTIMEISQFPTDFELRLFIKKSFQIQFPSGCCGLSFHRGVWLFLVHNFRWVGWGCWLLIQHTLSMNDKTKSNVQSFTRRVRDFKCDVCEYYMFRGKYIKNKNKSEIKLNTIS